MRVIPQGEKVLVKMVQAERVTSGGIIIPEPVAGKEDRAQMKAEVVDVGILAFEAERKHEKAFNRTARLPVPGDMIMMARHAGVQFEQDGVTYRLIQDGDVTAIIED